jgi:hypothetical protein
MNAGNCSIPAPGMEKNPRAIVYFVLFCPEKGLTILEYLYIMDSVGGDTMKTAKPFEYKSIGEKYLGLKREPEKAQLYTYRKTEKAQPKPKPQPEALIPRDIEDSFDEDYTVEAGGFDGFGFATCDPEF